MTARQRRPRRPNDTPTRHNILLAFGILGLVVLAFFILMGSNGFLDLQGLRYQLQSQTRRNDAIRTENRALWREVRRLEHDLTYIEAVARRELGLVRADETVLQFESDP